MYGQLYAAGDGVNQVALLLGCFLMLAIAGWALGRWPAKRGSAIAAVVLIALGLAIPLSQARSAMRAGRGDGECGTLRRRACDQCNSTEVVWQPYSEQALDAARAAGHPVFIDFTAAWCLSCQVNERAGAEVGGRGERAAKGGVVTMKADWTNEDPAITSEAGIGGARRRADVCALSGGGRERGGRAAGVADQGPGAEGDRAGCEVGSGHGPSQA